MCCCKTPNVNGNYGYSWDGTTEGTHPIIAPAILLGDVLLCDEPGRCGEIDSHSHHFRLVDSDGGVYLMVAHGGGERSFRLGSRVDAAIRSLLALDSDTRYWLLHRFYRALCDATTEATAKANARWEDAAREKRIKRRTSRGRVLVSIEPKA